jgi:hypothetical protein
MGGVYQERRKVINIFHMIPASAGARPKSIAAIRPQALPSAA